MKQMYRVFIGYFPHIVTESADFQVLGPSCNSKRIFFLLSDDEIMFKKSGIIINTEGVTFFPNLLNSAYHLSFLCRVQYIFHTVYNITIRLKYYNGF